MKEYYVGMWFRVEAKDEIDAQSTVYKNVYISQTPNTKGIIDHRVNDVMLWSDWVKLWENSRNIVKNGKTN